MPGPGLDLFGPEEEAEVLDVLRSRELSRYRFDSEATPSKVLRFERELSSLTGSRHCLGMNSCTSALLAGLLAAGIGPGDEVVVPGYTFVASMAAVAYTGASPVVAEVDRGLLLSPDGVRRVITDRTSAILAVHMLGAPCDLDGLFDVANRHDLLLFEDCAQAVGGQYKGRHLGTFGAFGAFSLNVFKTITAGDGGVLLTDDTALYERAFAIHDHGAAPLRLGVTDGPPVLGLNLRMHEMTGALALAQVRKLPGLIATLQRNRERLRHAVGDLPSAQERPSHDLAGDCATSLVYTFSTAELAARVAARLGTITLDASGKHNYANIPALTQRQRPLRPPGSAEQVDLLPAPSRQEALTFTDSVLSRSIALSIGVVDSYLGTGVGIDILSSDDDIDEMGRRFRSVVLAEIGLPA